MADLEGKQVSGVQIASNDITNITANSISAVQVASNDSEEVKKNMVVGMQIDTEKITGKNWSTFL